MCTDWPKFCHRMSEVGVGMFDVKASSKAPNYARNRSSVLEILNVAPKNIKIRAVSTKLEPFTRERPQKRRTRF